MAIKHKPKRIAILGELKRIIRDAALLISEVTLFSFEEALRLTGDQFCQVCSESYQRSAESNALVQTLAEINGSAPLMAWRALLENYNMAMVSAPLFQSGAQTYIFDTGTILSVLNNPQQFDDPAIQNAPLTLPQDPMIIQPAGTILEYDIFEDEDPSALPAKPSRIEAMAIGKNHVQGGYLSAVFCGGAVEVGFWKNEDDVLLTPHSDTATNQQNQATLRAVTAGCAALLNMQALEVRRVTIAKPTQNLQKRQGKPKLDDYYVTYQSVPGAVYSGDAVLDAADSKAGGKGSEHGYEYKVIPHERTLASGKVVEVKAHKRGLKHAGKAKPEKVIVVKDKRGST